MIGDHRLAQLVVAVERQRPLQQIGDRAKDRPVLACFARREHRALAALHPALEIDPGAVLLGIGRAGKHEVRHARARVAVVADVDLE